MLFVKKKLNLHNPTSFDFILLIIISIWAVVVFYPFYNSILVSLVSQNTYVNNPFMLFPKEINFDSYKIVLESKALWSGYAVTIFTVVVGTLYNLFFTVTTGFALSRSSFFGKKFIMNMIIFTMFFSGGLIPFYMLVISLGLKDTLFALFVPASLDTFNMLLVRNYFLSLPKALEESARIDGANDITIMTKIYIPIAMPVIVTVALFYAVGHWNNWYSALLFIRDPNLRPLQLVLRSIIVENASAVSGSPLVKTMFSEGVKMASIIFTIVPIMLVYPFIQGYFIKGIMVGSIKE
jgi:putative aldouronate transport system permease protein